MQLRDKIFIALFIGGVVVMLRQPPQLSMVVGGGGDAAPTAAKLEVKLALLRMAKSLAQVQKELHLLPEKYLVPKNQKIVIWIFDLK